MANNTTEEKVEILWAYVPAKLFAERIVSDYENYSIEIEGGHIIARISAAFFSSHPGLRDSLAQDLKVYFLALNLIRRKPFEIRGGSIKRILADGREDITLAVDPVEITLVLEEAIAVLQGPDGKVRHIRAGQIDDMAKKIAELSVRQAPTNPTVRRMLESYDAAIRYPGNELVYLYEVWEALQTKFRRTKNAQKALGISRTDRSRLTKLANKEPLNQGRHRGRFADRLRDATNAELSEARMIARGMIEKYLSFLDDK